MSMFCYQCQEAAKGTGCTIKGVCGKTDDVAKLMDVLIYVLKGISVYADAGKELNLVTNKLGKFVAEGLFTTITNANFDAESIKARIKEAFAVRDELAKEFLTKYENKYNKKFDGQLHDSATWYADSDSEIMKKAEEVSILSQPNEDVRSLRELLIYGLKGMAAYYEHAAVLGFEKTEISEFMLEGLASTTKDLSVDEMIAMVMKTGEYSVQTMAMLDEANTTKFGNPEITEVNIGVGKNPGILISGHDLKDMSQLLEQTKGTGVDIYTHSEMLPAHYYPAFKKYDHFVGNYGNAWWKQGEEFTSFNGPIIMTTNCITPVKDAYKDRIFTTGVTGYPGVKHIPTKEDGTKDFSKVIELAKKCQAPTEIETGKIVGGFAHNQVMQLADKVVDAVKTGAIKKFVVMAGCDGRMNSRNYYTDLAKGLPNDTVILTAGCAKYRYNKLELGDIGGIPRVLDAGQCNDSYSLAVIALKLKEVFGLEDVNQLPIEYDIAWYEQKAVTVLLALLFLGVKGIRLGPTLPAFLSPNVAKVLVENFDIKPIGSVEEDIKAITV